MINSQLQTDSFLSAAADSIELILLEAFKSEIVLELTSLVDRAGAIK